MDSLNFLTLIVHESKIWQFQNNFHEMHQIWIFQVPYLSNGKMNFSQC